MEIDRRAFFASLGGAAVIEAMSSEAKAEALEHYMSDLLDGSLGGAPHGAVEQVVAAPPEATVRRGAGSLFTPQGNGANRRMPELKPMPDKPTLVDFFNLRWAPANHVLQSATRALKTGMTEQVILACLLHDVVQNLIKVDHGWWGAQMIRPYVDEKIAWAINYHQALRFYPDSSVGYEYPELYVRIYGKDYVPPQYIKDAYEYAKKHKWYMEARLITVNDLYAFEPGVQVSLDPFIDIIGRHFKQPKEGLGFDNSPTAHMWRTMMFPDNPL
jgi:hypothetical protein